MEGRYPTLKRFGYANAQRGDRGVLRRYLAKATGLSRAQLARRIAQFLDTGQIKDGHAAPARPFARRYTADDIRLLAEIDALHGTLSGSTTCKLCQRACEVYGDARFERLATISNGHLYHLRGHKTYRAERGAFDRTRPVAHAIGERRKPAPDHRPGFLRVDSVHQGDLDGIKGVYLINAVDEVTPCQCVCAVEKISEAFLLPGALGNDVRLPVRHSGLSQRQRVGVRQPPGAALLEKLCIEQTQSRSRHSNDNALAESKNASTVRKHLARAVNAFTEGVLSPYLNYHRPCHFPMEFIDQKGKVRKRYRYADMMTPYDKLKSLSDAARYLKSGMTFNRLDEIARECSDNEAAKRLNAARAKLFQLINKSRPRAA